MCAAREQRVGTKRRTVEGREKRGFGKNLWDVCERVG